MLKSSVVKSILPLTFSVLCFFPSISHATIETSVSCRSAGSSLYGGTLCNNPGIHENSVATAYGSGGTIKAAAIASAWDHSHSSAAFAHVRISDWYVISSAGMAGQIGTTSMIGHYQMHSTTVVGSAGESAATASSMFSMANISPGAGRGEIGRTAILNHFVDSNGTHLSEYFFATNNGVVVSYNTPMSVSFDFVYDAPIYLTIDLQVSAGAQFDGTGILDASHSFYWGGLEVAGLERGQYTLTSGSGTDWSRSFLPAPQDLPEPPMFLLGLTLLALCQFARTVGAR